MLGSSVVIGTTNLFTVAVRELKDNAILLIHADTEETGEISAKLFQNGWPVERVGHRSMCWHSTNPVFVAHDPRVRG
jgi:hypothetical protein